MDLFYQKGKKIQGNNINNKDDQEKNNELINDISMSENNNINMSKDNNNNNENNKNICSFI